MLTIIHVEEVGVGSRGSLGGHSGNGNGEKTDDHTGDGGSSDEDTESDKKLVVAPCRCPRNSPTQFFFFFLCSIQF